MSSVHELIFFFLRHIEISLPERFKESEEKKSLNTMVSQQVDESPVKKWKFFI